MRGYIKIGLFLCFLGFLVPWGRGWASPKRLDPDQPTRESDYICSTRLQLRYPHRCKMIGPAGQLADYARRGIYPEQPLPASPVDPELAYVPISYLKVTGKDVGVYSSLNEAVEGKDSSRSLGKGSVYLSWIDRYEKEGKVVYQIGPGAYIRGDNVSRIGLPKFRGLIFSQTPKNAFGWMMGSVQSSIAPGYDQPLTSNTYYRFQVVQIYDIAKAADFEWYMIGPGEWIEQRQIAMVSPNTSAPKGVEGDRWISVNLFEQTIAAYEAGELVFATLISSGLSGWWTRPGVFQVYEKLESDDMQGAFEADRSDFYYLQDVPWILYYDDARAIHGTYWHNNYGYPQSHGCVNLSPADSHWIFDWAEVGTWVYVWDPSGETPTDPESYETGGE